MGNEPDLSQLEDSRAHAREIYEERIRAGLQMNPPFKGFGIAFLWFAMDEPELYKLLMTPRSPSASLEEYIDRHVGFREECVAAIMASAHLPRQDAQSLYYQMIHVALGLAFSIVTGGCQLNIRQASEIIGKCFRAFLMEIHAGADDRVGFIPREGGTGPRGSVDSYVDKGLSGIRKHAQTLMLHTLVSQNRLLQDLHKSPRYIRDTEWTELIRILRNTFEVTPESLRRRYPFLTPGDIRLILLMLFRFTTGESAILLGISRPSVTKARQRLKAKLKVDSIESFLDAL